jgi:hypothetical protein
LAFSDATILGMPLASLVDNMSLPKPLSVITLPDGGVTMAWEDVALKSSGPFKVGQGGSKLTLTVVRSPAQTVTMCRVSDFSLVLPPGGDLIDLHFDALEFRQVPGEAPDLIVEGFRFKLGGHLALLQTLQEKVKFGDTAPAVRSTPNGMHAGYAVAVVEVVAGMFVLKNIAASVGVEVPFDGKPIVTTLAFASRDDPFNLSVSVFGGGGYLVFEIAEEGIRTLEASLEFGASVAISVGFAKAEVHALGGATFALVGNEVRVSGFLRIGGGVDVLGLVSVSVELRVELDFHQDPKTEISSLTGRATAVIEIDVTFWSGSVHLDSGTYTFLGPELGRREGAPPPAIETIEPELKDWKTYREKFERI